MAPADADTNRCHSREAAPDRECQRSCPEHAKRRGAQRLLPCTTSDILQIVQYYYLPRRVPVRVRRSV